MSSKGTPPKPGVGMPKVASDNTRGGAGGTPKEGLGGELLGGGAGGPGRVAGVLMSGGSGAVASGGVSGGIGGDVGVGVSRTGVNDEGGLLAGGTDGAGEGRLPGAVGESGVGVHGTIPNPMQDEGLPEMTEEQIDAELQDLDAQEEESPLASPPVTRRAPDASTTVAAVMESLGAGFGAYTGRETIDESVVRQEDLNPNETEIYKIDRASDGNLHTIPPSTPNPTFTPSVTENPEDLGANAASSQPMEESGSSQVEQPVPPTADSSATGDVVDGDVGTAEGEAVAPASQGNLQTAVDEEAPDETHGNTPLTPLVSETTANQEDPSSQYTGVNRKNLVPGSPESPEAAKRRKRRETLLALKKEAQRKKAAGKAPTAGGSSSSKTTGSTPAAPQPDPKMPEPMVDAEYRDRFTRTSFKGPVPFDYDPQYDSDGNEILPASGKGYFGRHKTSFELKGLHMKKHAVRPHRQEIDLADLEAHELKRESVARAQGRLYVSKFKRETMEAKERRRKQRVVEGKGDYLSDDNTREPFIDPREQGFTDAADRDAWRDLVWKREQHKNEFSRTWNREDWIHFNDGGWPGEGNLYGRKNEKHKGSHGYRGPPPEDEEEGVQSEEDDDAASDLGDEQSISTSSMRSGEGFKSRRNNPKSAPPDFEKYYKEFNEGLNDLKKVHKEMKLQEIQAAAAHLQYTGFNREEIMKTFSRRAMEAGLSAKNAWHDLCDVVLVVVMRGVRVDKMKMNISPAGLTLINKLIGRYGIHTKRTKPKASSTLTFSRLATCNPHIMALYYRIGLNQPIGIIPEGFPKWLCFPSAPALMPRTPHGAALYEKWGNWNRSFSAIINKGVSMPNSNVDFGTLSRDSTQFSEEERIRLLEYLESSDEVFMIPQRS